MKKNTVIATCLVNSKFLQQLKEAEAAVKKIFEDEYPDDNYTLWNSDIPDKYAQNIINTVGKASTINVKKFIKDLWE